MEQIIAMIPITQNEVEKTVVIDSGGAAWMENLPTKTYANRLARLHGVSVRSQRKRDGRRGVAVHFGYGEEDLFIQLKMASCDRGLGYVKLTAIEGIFVDGDGKCTLTLTGGATVHTGWNLMTCEQHMREGAALSRVSLHVGLLYPRAEEKERMAAARQAALSLAG